ncbi:MAG: hypothetical protein JOZ41_07525 [Chloroflexi bacterium]|nr:hypothetical protein [Chloroflexota bacterium]
MRVENVDILDDRDPVILIQRYVLPSRTYQVIRKPTSPTERFSLSPGVEVDPDAMWGVHILLETPTKPESGVSEVFATIDVEENNPPVTEADDLEDSDVHGLIVRDAETGKFRAEAVYVSQGEIFSAIATDTIDEAIRQAVQALDEWLAANPNEEP